MATASSARKRSARILRGRPGGSATGLCFDSVEETLNGPVSRRSPRGRLVAARTVLGFYVDLRHRHLHVRYLQIDVGRLHVRRGDVDVDACVARGVIEI